MGKLTWEVIKAFIRLHRDLPNVEQFTYLKKQQLPQTLCLARLGSQESETQVGHKHKTFQLRDNLFAQTKVKVSKQSKTLQKGLCISSSHSEKPNFLLT